MLGRSSILVATLVTCALAALSGGCNGSDDAPDRGRATERREVLEGPLRQLVTNRDVNKTPAHSPERALMSWFQAVQFKDVTGVKLLIAPAELERVGDKRIAAATDVVGAALGKPSIVSKRRTGTSASIRTLIRAFEKGRSRAVSTEPESFEMVQSGDSWLLGDVSYLLNAAEDIRRARAAQPQ